MFENRRSVRATVSIAMLAIAALAGSIVIVGSAAAAQEVEQTCVTIDNNNTRLLATSAGVEYTKIQPVDLPAGVIDIPSARAWDAYPTRASTWPQPSERYEIEFLDAAGNVIATSMPTEDVPDRVMEGEWVGPLGSVTLPVPAAGVRAHHRNDLPADGSPDSVNAGEFTLCYTPMQVTTTVPGETTTTTEPVTTVPGETTTTTEPVTTVPGETTTTTEPVTTVPGETTTTAPAETTSTTGVATTPLGPTTTQATTSTTAATTSTTAATTSTTTKPLGSGLPVTGSNTGWLLGSAAVLVAAGTVLLSISRRSDHGSA